MIPRLLQDDPSWIQIPEVSAYIHTKRQDLLTPFLTPREYKSTLLQKVRFSSGTARFIPSFDSGFIGWTAKQQELYAKAQRELLKTNKRSGWELYAAVNIITQMPSVDLTPVIDIASLETEDKGLRDRALTALGKTDSGRGLPTLLEALSDERARIAIYAARRALLNLPADKAIALLQTVPQKQITVAKEIVRLIGDIGGEAAFNLLLNHARLSDIHRDVRIALLRGLWNYLDREETWQLFSDTIKSKDSALIRSTIRIPEEGLSEIGQDKFCQHLVKLLNVPDPLILRETLERIDRMPPACNNAPNNSSSDKSNCVREQICQAVARLLEDDNFTIYAMAISAFISLSKGRNDVELARQLSGLSSGQALKTMVAVYAVKKKTKISGLEPSVELIIEHLFQKRRYSALALELAFHILLPLKALDWLERFEGTDLFHPDAISHILNALKHNLHKQNVIFFYQIIDKLNSHKNPLLRWLSLKILLRLKEISGWGEQERTLLKSSLADPEQWIAECAELIELPPLPDQNKSIH